MKRLRILVPALLALLVLGAMAASSASAIEGLLPVGQSFTVLSGSAKLEAGAETITCAETKGNGKGASGETETGNTHGSFTLDFLGCEVAGFPAFSLGEKEPKVVTEALILVSGLYLICLINSASLIFGVIIEVGPTVHIHVPVIGALLNVKGSVIGESTTAAKTKTKLLMVKFAGEKGKPANPECKNSAGTVKKAKLESEKDPEAAKEANEKVEALLQYTNEVELMDT